MSRRQQTFLSIRTEGGLLPQELLSRIASGDPDLPFTDASSYHLGAHERIGEEVNRIWNLLVQRWHAFQDARVRLPADDLGTSLTRERWLLPLFQELGYGRLQRTQALEVDGQSFAVSHAWQQTPIHLLGAGVDLDERRERVAGAARSSPHGLVQDLLNRSDDHLWGFLSNGLKLRILRDHHSLTRQAYVEFDLEAIMDGEQYSEFLVLWLLCHQSRVEAERPEDCPLEVWFSTAQDEGIRALDKLRGGVEAAISALGSGFLKHRKNRELQRALEDGRLDRQEFFRQILRVAYRLIFLFVAEERDMLLDPGGEEGARKRFLRFYSTRRLRDLAERRRGGRHGDVWQGLRLVMSKLEEGCPELALPALGSWLWSDDSCAWPTSSECANEDFLEAVRRLSTMVEDRTRYSVSWRNVGAEELGSIYESLLELQPTMNREAGTFSLEIKPGHERKETSSYYTHTALVECLLDSALDPVLAGAASAQQPETAILGLRVCDPACGSGHFLVAAARRIAQRLAAVRAGVDEPSPREVQHALRDVIGHCLYGVDLNPMAVELCKVALWMEALEPGRPLSFLDHRIRCGNAVVGATPRLLSQGIPDAAFTAIEGDDKPVCTQWRKINKGQRESGQRSLFDYSETQPWEMHRGLATLAADLETIDDQSLEGVRRQQQSYESRVRSAEYRVNKLWADAWCAAFFWCKNQGCLPPVTEGVFRTLLSSPDEVPQVVRDEISALASRYRFFHWHLEFPEVFSVPTAGDGVDNPHTGWSGGFDVMFGNPPWDALSPDTKEFFSPFNLEIRFKDSEGQKEIIEELLESPDIAEAWAEHRRDLFAQAQFFKNSGVFTMYAPGNLGKGDFNIFRMFTELTLRFTSPGGSASQVVPDGLYIGANCMAIRKAMFEEFKLNEILGFHNNGGTWFKGIHPSAKFCIYAASRSGSATSFKAAFNIRTPAELARVQDGESLTLPVGIVKEFSPEALAVMEFGSQLEIDIAAKMYARWPKFGGEFDDSPNRDYMRAIDMGNDRHRFSEVPPGMPLYEGRMVGQFDHRAKGYRSGRGRSAVWEVLPFSGRNKSIQSQWWIPFGLIPQKAFERVKRYRVGWCDVASSTNERSLVAALLPPGTIAGDTVPTFVFEKEYEWAYLTWLAVANSFSMDFLVRQKVQLHLKYYILDSLPFPRLGEADRATKVLVPLVLSLSCTGPELTDFWNSMASRGYVESVAPGDTPPGILDEDDRLTARAEIDAFVAFELFDLSREELEYILSTFPTAEKYEVQKYGEFRSKRLILGLHDEMKLAREEGRPYQTRLDPPPWVPRQEVPTGTVTYGAPEVVELRVAQPDGEDTEDSSAYENDDGGREGYVPAAADPEFTDGDGQLNSLLAFLKENLGPRTRSEILEATGIPPAAWNRLRQQVENHPRVRKTGERRGTRYEYLENFN